MKYYIKTQRNGHLRSSDSNSFSRNKSVNTKELLIYKILEELLLGVETHFFY